jgi:uncharacterized membrane protein YphA (DoxX/SURF4 family)
MAVDARAELRNPAYQGYLVLRSVFVIAPILFGIDKFYNWMVDWPHYLAPWINDHIARGHAQQFMWMVGAVEILAGVIVLLAPRLGSLVVAAWLAGIVVNLLTNSAPQFYDIALRDFGLFGAALTLNRLATAFGIQTLRSEVAKVRGAGRPVPSAFSR